MSNAILPQYLERLKPSKRYYGTLTQKDNCWIVEAEPQVMELVRRVFKATSDDIRGRAVIPCNKRINEDLNWLMMRYPLKILSFSEWKAALELTRKYIEKRQIINSRKTIQKPPVDFKTELLDFQKEGLASPRVW